MLTDTDLTSLPGVALACAIRSRDISCAEVVDAHLRRIASVNPSLNAVVQSRTEAAVADAREADARLARGESLGPLHGVPFTVKDAFDQAGVPSTSGTLGRAGFVPSKDATAVTRLRQAGAIPVGTTNTPELTLAYETDNLIYGRTNNPYDVSRTPGGSSGGEAAIIAAGGSPFGIGTDIGGSLRVPAHYCGIASLKPTLGRVPTTGVFPPAFGIVGGVYHVGPLARSVADLSVLLDVIAGPDGQDLRTAPVAMRGSADVRIGELRVAYFADNGIAPADSATVSMVAGAARAVADAGASITEARPAGVEQSFDLFPRLLGADGGASIRHLLEMIGTTQPHPLLLQMAQVLQPFAMPTEALVGLLTQIDIFRMQMLAFLGQFDVVISPVTDRPAVPHGTTLNPDTLAGFSYVMTHSLTGWPVVVVRAGTSPEGLPIGVQIAAAPWREDHALAAAVEVERALGGWRPAR